MTLLTGGGQKEVEVFPREGVVEWACVAMGAPRFAAGKVPVNLPLPEVVDYETTVGGRVARITCLSMGNPHCIIFVPDVSQVDVAVWGPLIERDPMFPQRVNASFIQVEGKRTLRMRVWERGLGETPACGTGACAAAVAAVRLGYCPKDADITLHLPGGDLVVRVEEGQVWLTGDAQKDFEGILEV